MEAAVCLKKFPTGYVLGASDKLNGLHIWFSNDYTVMETMYSMLVQVMKTRGTPLKAGQSFNHEWGRRILTGNSKWREKMFLASLEPNDCEVGIKNGKFFITGITRCCHGNIVNQTTIWFSLELAEKLKDVVNYDDLKSQIKPRWNQNTN